MTAPSWEQLVADLRNERADLRALVVVADLDGPTAAPGWSVRDTVAHLAGTDREALRAVTDPEGFVADRPADHEVAALLGSHLQARMGLAREDLLRDWDEGADALLEAASALEPGTRVPWYGPAMSPATFLTARLMETWAHGTDVADVLGVAREVTPRLRHVAHLGVRTRGFAFANRDLPVPDGDVRVELTGPLRATWAWGPAGAADVVRGPALDFCLLVTQRRHRDDLALVATGAGAHAWLDVGQCFAGPPGPGRVRSR